MSKTRPTAVLLAVAYLVSAQIARADDDDIRPKKMRFIERGDRLTVTSTFTELFDRQAFERLSSGFPTRVVVRGWVYRKGHDIPLAYTLASYRVVYSLWDGTYTIRSDGPDGSTTNSVRKKSDVLKSITQLDRFPIADLDRIEVGPHYVFALAVELNPVSEELLAETRRWLSQPAGKGRLGASSSMFGSFVSVFVNPKLSEAERVLRFRSQPFFRVSR